MSVVTTLRRAIQTATARLHCIFVIHLTCVPTFTFSKCELTHSYLISYSNIASIMTSQTLRWTSRFPKLRMLSAMPLRHKHLIQGVNICNEVKNNTLNTSTRHSQQMTDKGMTRACGRKQQALTIGSGFGFWMSKEVWKRSGINTFRCLIGCTTGDFATMWYLQSLHPGLSTVTTMSLSSEYSLLSYVICSLLVNW